MFKSSSSIILTIIVGLYLASWGGMLPVEYSWAPFSALAAWSIMDLLSFFKRERIRNASGAYLKDEALEETRGDAFKRKMEQGQKDGYQPDDDEAPDMVIRMVNQDGVVSAITIKSNGEMDIEGDVEPEIMDALLLMSDAIKDAGPEVMAMEIARQLEILNAQKQKEYDDE